LDKLEYQIRLTEMNKLVDAQDDAGAAKIADSIDWRRVKSIRTLCTVSEVYEANRRYDDAREILLLAYSHAQRGRQILYRLAEISIKMKQFDEAVDFYTEFVQLSPNDNSKYILKYKIYRGRGSSIEDQIRILEEYKEKEYTEQYTYELAKLYAMNGEVEKCIQECDDISLWFNEGKYVYKAMELKMKYAPLSQSQRAIYDARNEVKEKPIFMEEALKEEYYKAEEEKADLRTAEKEALDKKEDQKVLEHDLKDTANISAADIDSGYLADILIAEAEKEIAKSVSEGILNGTLANEMLTKDKNIDITKDELEYSREDSEDTKDDSKDIKKESEDTRDGLKGTTDNSRDTKEAFEVTKDGSRNMKDSLQSTKDGLRSTKDGLQHTKEDLQNAKEELDSTNDNAEDTREDFKDTKEDLDSTKATIDNSTYDESKTIKFPVEEIKRVLKEVSITKEPVKQTLNDSSHSIKAPEETLAEETIDIKLSGIQPIEEPQLEEKPEDDLQERVARNMRAILSQVTPNTIQEGLSAEEEQEDQIEGQMSIEDFLTDGATDTKAVEINMEDDLPEDISDILNTEFSLDDELQELTRRTEELLEQEEKAKQEAEEKAKQEAEEKAKQEAEEKAKQEAEEKAKQEAEEKAKQEAEEKAKQEAEEKAKQEAEEKANHKTKEAGQGTEEELVLPPIVEEDPEFDFSSLLEAALDALDMEDNSVEDKEVTLDEINTIEGAKVKEDKDIAKEDAAEENYTAKNEEISEDKTVEKTKDSGLAGNTENTSESSKVEEPIDSYAKEVDDLNRKGKLSEEQKTLFSYFAPVQGMGNQLAEALTSARDKDPKDRTSKIGNIVIMGEHGTGKTALAMHLVKAIAKDRDISKVKIKQMDASDINNTDVAALIGKMEEQALVIESAGMLNDQAVEDLSRAMEFRTNGLIIVLEDEKKQMRKLLANHEEFENKFTTKINIPIFTNDELVSFGKAYAKELDYKIDDMGILALYNNIGENQSEADPVTVADVKDMVDAAIKRAEKFGFNRLGRILLNKRYDKEDRILLYEKDFR
jgi:hypothetical protein